MNNSEELSGHSNVLNSLKDHEWPQKKKKI